MRFCFICVCIMSLCSAFRFQRGLVRNLRLFSTERVLNADLVAKDPEFVRDYIKRRGLPQLESSVQTIGELRVKLVESLSKYDKARSVRKKLSNQIGSAMKAKNMDTVAALKLKVEEANADASNAEASRIEIEEELNRLFRVFPNMLDDSVPRGSSEEDNVVVSTWGTPRIGNNFQWHDDLASALNGYNVEAAVKISGSRFNVLLGNVAKLERALIQYFLDLHTSNGYTEVSVPYIVSRSCLEGTGQLPKFEEQLFKLNHFCSNDEAFLIPTAEVPVTNLFREQILDLSQLPIKLCSHTPCFRAEADASGKDDKGLIRQHQFHKVELVKICSAENSAEEHESMTRDIEMVLESLELPYRRVLLCDVDTGFSASKCYDIEVWLPGQQKYREISSVSNCKDFQSRRMMLRFKRKAESKTEYPHTLNGSGLAIGRALAAILENYQQPDGSVDIPKVLQPYMNGKTKLEPAKRIL